MLEFEVIKSIQKRKVSDIIYKEDIYARKEFDQRLITTYEENIEPILAEAKIQISMNNILIDGYHRWKAIERKYGSSFEFDVIVHETDNTDYIEIESYAANQRHGKRNSKEETARNIQRLYAKGHSSETIMAKLSVNKSTFFDATKKQREDEKEERDRKIVDLYLKCFTQEEIAKRLGVTHPTVLSVVENVKNSALGEFYNSFKPLLYNIWNTPKQDNERKHFGAFPEIFMENLLHYHTDPLDIIYDPFGGGGTTVDICKRMFRRYYVTDRKVIPGRENDIHQHDIKDGLPDIPKPKMVFLDPPYWLQAENQYSEDVEDLGNMSIEDFNKSMRNILTEIKKRKVELIACVIQPTQYKSAWRWTDHIIDFHEMVNDKYSIEMRYIIPYSSEQYLPQMVIKAKEANKCMSTFRDLIVWRMK